MFASWLFASAAIAQQYPARVVRIVTAEVSGGGDFVARTVAQGLTESLKQQVIVDNRSGVQSIEIVSRASPDGHTLLVYGSTIWLLPYFRAHAPWDPIRDFAPITIPGSSPNVLAVHPAIAVSSVKELIALARAKPGDLTYGANHAGATQVAAELFKSMAELDIRHIPYKGNGPALIGLLAGEVQVMFPNAVGGRAPCGRHRIRRRPRARCAPCRFRSGPLRRSEARRIRSWALFGGTTDRRPRHRGRGRNKTKSADRAAQSESSV